MANEIKVLQKKTQQNGNELANLSIIFNIISSYCPTAFSYLLCLLQIDIIENIYICENNCNIIDEWIQLPIKR